MNTFPRLILLLTSFFTPFFLDVSYGSDRSRDSFEKDKKVRILDLGEWENLSKFDRDQIKLESEKGLNCDYVKFKKPDHSPRDATEQKSLIIKDKVLGRNQEEKLLIEGKDRRLLVQETHKWPHRLHCRLYLHFPKNDNLYGGSGTLVGPCHILTAGHNVYDHKENLKWVHKITAYPGLNGGKSPFGNVNVHRVYVREEWVEAKNKEFDLALLILDKCIGNDLGWCGLISYGSTNVRLKDMEIRITGYPVNDKGHQQMFTMKNNIGSLKLERIFYDIDTEGGQSGSSIVLCTNREDKIEIENEPCSIGVHTDSEEIKGQGNSGVYLSPEKLELIVDWIHHSNGDRWFFVKREESDLVSSMGNFRIAGEKAQDVDQNTIRIKKMYESGMAAFSEKKETEKLFKHAVLLSIDSEKREKSGSLKVSALCPQEAENALVKLISFYLNAKEFNKILIWCLINEGWKSKYLAEKAKSNTKSPDLSNEQAQRADQEAISLLKDPTEIVSYLDKNPILDLSWGVIKSQLEDVDLGEDKLLKFQLTSSCLNVIKNIIDKNKITKLRLQGNRISHKPCEKDMDIRDFLKDVSSGLKDLDLRDNGISKRTLNSIVDSIMSNDKNITIDLRGNEDIKDKHIKNAQEKMKEKKDLLKFDEN